jgi:PadR family transcriptional regulator PadR
MTRHRPHSPQTVRVLRALATDPAAWRHGYDLATELGLKSGSLYPILIRLSDRGLLDSRWEPAEAGRPPRHVYRLTADGLAQARVPAKVAATSRSRRRTQLGTA